MRRCRHDSSRRTTLAVQHLFHRSVEPHPTVLMCLQIFPQEVDGHTGRLAVQAPIKAPRFVTLHQRLLLLLNIFSPRRPTSPPTWHEDTLLQTFASTDGSHSSSPQLSLALLPIPDRIHHLLPGHHLLIEMAMKINNVCASHFPRTLYKVQHACIHSRVQQRLRLRL